MKELVKGNVISSPQSQKIRRQEKLAKGIIWFLAILTIAILFWIVSYLMVKGFRYNNHVPYDVSNDVEYSIPMSNSDEDLVFIIHHKTRSEDIPVAGLRKLYNKVRSENWGFYNQQNLKAAPFSYSDGASFSRAAEDFILRGSDLEEFRKNVTEVSSWNEMIQSVGSQAGGLGYIPASQAENLPKNVKVLGIRRTSVAVHPSVLQIQDGKMMRELSAEDLQRILNGEIRNWQEVGGTDLALTLIEDHRIDELLKTEGAVTLCHYADLEESGLSFLPVLRYERGWNLTWHFIFEAPARSGQWGGISYIIINTFVLILFTILFSTPVGIMAAIYMVEYANQGRIMRLLRMNRHPLWTPFPHRGLKI